MRMVLISLGSTTQLPSASSTPGVNLNWKWKVCNIDCAMSTPDTGAKKAIYCVLNYLVEAQWMFLRFLRTSQQRFRDLPQLGQNDHSCSDAKPEKY